jgi:glucose-6-phosphate dehydrogenase assembly protein OpcA
VASAVSTILKPDSEVVWSGEAVNMSKVLDALDDIRARFARSEVDDLEHAHPRNCVMTLIAVAATQEEERRAERTCRLIGIGHPAQAIVIREDNTLEGNHIDAWITADIQRPEMSCAVECEIVTLHVRSAAADHLGALVDPLLVSGVPTYLWFVGTPPFGRREIDEGLSICDALVVDSARFAEPYTSFRELAKVISRAHTKLGLGDLQWSRLRPWREAIAQFFTPLDRRHFLDGMAEVGIDYEGEGRGNRIAGALLAGWMASALGWKIKRAAAGTGGVVVVYYEVGGRTVEVQFRSVTKEHLAAGELSAVRIAGTSRGATFRLSVQRDPDRPRTPSGGYREVHSTEGEDDAGLELAERSAERHRDVLHENLSSLHHSATGDPSGESRPKHPVVSTRERRGTDTAQVLLTMIELGESAPLRHVQQVEPEDDAALLLDVLSSGTHDTVFTRSLEAASDLLQRL